VEIVVGSVTLELVHHQGSQSEGEDKELLQYVDLDSY